MKMLKLLYPFIVLFFFMACENSQVSKSVSLKIGSVESAKATFQEAQKMAMSIDGMVCAVGCAAMIEKTLNKTKGIKEAKVDFEAKKASLIFDAKILSPNEVTNVIHNLSNGYAVTDLKLLD